MKCNQHWQLYHPTESTPWNADRVGHLHRRAAFSPTGEELARDLTAGFDKSIDRLLHPVGPQLHKLTSLLTEQAISRESIAMLQAAWVNEMWHGTDPLREQLALMWHNHFATSFLKVQSCSAMNEQLGTFRKLARAPFGELLHAIVRDRAMLIWLDADRNQSGRPNENLARELLELFALGESNYNEQDVLESARALTGWIVDSGKSRFDSSRHDDTEKEILGKRRSFDADSLVELLLAQPAMADRLAWRICDHFLGADVASTDQQNELACVLRSNHLDVGAAVETLLRSKLLFANERIKTRYASPVSFVVGNIRALGFHGVSDGEQVSPGVAAIWMRVLGQDLLNPPGVGGWPGGRSWIGADTMINRARFALQLTDGQLFPRWTALDRHGNNSRLEDAENIAKSLVTAEAQFD